jgi:hypothetical protein
MAILPFSPYQRGSPLKATGCGGQLTFFPVFGDCRVFRLQAIAFPALHDLGLF